MSFLFSLIFPTSRVATDAYIDNCTPDNLNFYKTQKEGFMYIVICFLSELTDTGIKYNYSKIRTDISRIFDYEVSYEKYDSFFADIPKNFKDQDEFQEFIFQLSTYEQRLQILQCLFMSKMYSTDKQQFDAFLLRSGSFLKCRKVDFIKLKNEF